jgi:hypothetical protein
MTEPPQLHFFGYYGVQPWNAAEDRLLCLEVSFQDRPPRASDEAVIGVVDCDTLEFSEVSRTRAWNFQQGCMLHWLPTAPDSSILFNTLLENRFCCVILDLETRERRVLPRPISAVSHDGKRAISLNFARLHAKRPGYGYAGLPDPHRGETHPSDDGVYVVDLESGEDWMAVSMQDVYEMRPQGTDLEDLDLWFNHTIFNADDSRLAFLARFSRQNLRGTAMFTVDPEGEDLRCLVDYGLVSHYDWMDSRRILAWADVDSQGDGFYLLDDGGGEYRRVGESVLKQDGHCSFSPDGEWILTDTYPDADRMGELMIYRWRTGDLVSLGRFHSHPDLVGQIRCDLHPRWSRKGDKVCFDSTHKGTRQLYVMDVPWGKPGLPTK